MKSFLIVLLALGLASGSCFARAKSKNALTPVVRQDDKSVPVALPVIEPPKKTFKKTESHLFAAAKLKGQLKKPELSYIYQRKGLRAEQIVNVPENFNQEIISGAGQF